MTALAGLAAGPSGHVTSWMPAFQVVDRARAKHRARERRIPNRAGHVRETLRSPPTAARPNWRAWPTPTDALEPPGTPTDRPSAQSLAVTVETIDHVPGPTAVAVA